MGYSIWSVLLWIWLSNPFLLGDKMKKFKLKKDLYKEKKEEQINKLLNIDSITDEAMKYRHIYRVLKMLGFSPGICRTLMTEKYYCANSELIENAIATTDSLELKDFETNSPFVDLVCTNHIDKYIVPEDDLVLSQDKEGNRKYIKISELKYYYFRLTKMAFKNKGYTNTIARNYFLSEGFRKEYKKQTNRSMSQHKTALFNKILNKYNLIKVYQVKKKANLYVLGKNNPCYYFQGVMEAETLRIVQGLIDDSNYRHVNLTPKDKRREELKETESILRKEIKALKKEVEDTKHQAEKNSQVPDDYNFAIERYRDLLIENSQLIKQQEQIDQWNIAYKPVSQNNYDEKFEEILKSDSNRKVDDVPDKVEDTEEQGDSMKEIEEVINSLESSYVYSSW